MRAVFLALVFMSTTGAGALAQERRLPPPSDLPGGLFEHEREELADQRQALERAYAEVAAWSVRAQMLCAPRSTPNPWFEEECARARADYDERIETYGKLRAYYEARLREVRREMPPPEELWRKLDT